MGVIRARLNEVIGAAETTALLGEEAPRAPKKTAARAALPEGVAFADALREERVSRIPQGDAFTKAIRG